MHRWLRPSLEALTCAFMRHRTPAAGVAALRPEDRGLGVDLPDGRRLARCLRCDAWVVALPPTGGVAVLPPLDQLDVPRRDSSLRIAVWLRVTAVVLALQGLVNGILSVGALLLSTRLPGVKAEALTLLGVLRGGAGTGTGSHAVTHRLEQVLALQPTTLRWLAGLAAIGFVLLAVTAGGLWRQHRWAAYLAVGAIAGLGPLELYEAAADAPTVPAALVALDVALALALIWNRRLFGIRGGRRADRSEWLDRKATFGPPA